MYECTNMSCAMKGSRLAEQAANALAFKCPACTKPLEKSIDRFFEEFRGADFPSVFAIPLKEYHEENNPLLKLWHACDLVEMSLRFLVIVGLADMKNNRGQLHRSVLKELQPRVDQPTFGKWKGMALAVAKHISSKNSYLQELPETVCGILVPLLDGPESNHSPENSFSSLRNRLAHGGGVTQSVANRLLQLWGPRVEEVIRKCSWFSELKLIVQFQDGSFGVLRGPEFEPSRYFVSSENEARLLGNIFVRGNEVALVRAGSAVSLWPLAIYGVPIVSDPDAPLTTQTAPQVYLRRGDVFLQFSTIGSNEVSQSEGDQYALDAFLSLFRFREMEGENPEVAFTVRGFESALRKDADRLVGRADALETIRSLVRQSNEGVLWLTGPAGIGKSYIIARFVTEALEDEQLTGTLILPYRFKAGDDRCSRDQFFRFTIERLKAWEPFRSESKVGREIKKPIEELKELLRGVPENRQVLLILDGLDEVVEHDRTFAQEVPLALSFRRVLWLCSGRPERGLSEAFAANHCQHVFPDGLPPMSQGDIRTMLLEKIGPLRKCLVRNDREQGDSVVNPFIDRVVHYASGLPIYVNYIIGDILGNRFRSLDAGERLPPSLAYYHDELMRRYSIGILQQLLTPLAATITVAQEPITHAALTELMIFANVLPNDSDAPALVSKGLSVIKGMLRRTTNPDGKEGFTLFHHSLRQHMQNSDTAKSTLITALTNLCRFDSRNDTAQSDLFRYSQRWRIVHLLQAGEIEMVIALLRSSEFVLEKCKSVGVDYVLNDLRVLANIGTREALASFDIALSNHAIEATSGPLPFVSLPAVPPSDDIAKLLRQGYLDTRDIRNVFTSTFRHWNQTFSLDISRMQILDSYFCGLAQAFRDTAEEQEVAQLRQLVNAQFLASTYGLGRDYRHQSISSQEDEPLGRFELILDILER